MAGKEHRRQGTQAFRRGEFLEAIEHFSKAIHEMPWIIPLYTNRALVSSAWWSVSRGVVLYEA